MPTTTRTPTVPPEERRSAEQLVGRLGSRYFVILFSVALLVVVDQAVVQPLLSRMSAFAPTINLAGRQRMLSQRLAKAALALQVAEDDAQRTARRTELRDSLEQWSTAHEALRHGRGDFGVPLVQTAEINRAWDQLQPHYDAMRAAAIELSRAGEEGKPQRQLQLSALVSVIAQHETPFLETMEGIVKLYEGEADREYRRLRIYSLAIAVVIITLLLGLGWLVVRPAARVIRRQVDDLELRVDARTAELADALASLRNESDERQQVEGRNQRLAAQLAHADRVETLGHLAGGLAHELNQPLGAIANYAEACDVILLAPVDEPGRERLQECFRQMKQAALRAGKIVRRIRNFVRPVAGVSVEIDLTVVVVEVLELCRPEAARTNTAIDADVPNAKVLVAADAIQIQQVLVNLVQNALQAMQETPLGRRRLAIRMSIGDSAVQVDVVDAGPGFASDLSDMIFEPFRTTKSEGLGIGLSICRSIIEQHGGTIWAKSTPGAGAQFSFALPLASRLASFPANDRPSPACQLDCICR